MKKSALTFAGTLLLLLTALPAAGQEDAYPLGDAILYNETTAIATKNQILKAYGTYAVLSGNHFLDLSGITATGITGATGMGTVASAEAGTGSPLGAPLINALSEVIAIRFKEELTLSFIESFRKKLEKNIYLAEIFPNAKLVLVNGNPFSYKVWLASFRGALDEDLKALPDNLPKLVNAIKNDPATGLSAAQITAIDTFLAAYTPALEYSKNPEKSYQCITKFLNNLSTVNYADTNVNGGIIFANVLIKELGNSSYTDWPSRVTLTNLKNYNTFKTFIGFTIEKNSIQLKATPITLAGVATNLYDYFRSLPVNRIDEVVLFTKNLASNAIATLALVNELKELRKTNPKLGYDSYVPLIYQGLESIKMLADPNNFKLIIPVTVNVQKFSELVSNAQDCITLYTTVKTYIVNKEYAKIVVTTLTFIEKQIDQNNLDKSGIIKEFIKYADLATNIAAAETSEQMVAAIEGAALPTQSYRLKRNSYFSVTLNSYAGVFGGAEVLQNSEAEHKIAPIIGFTAPIGVGLNWGINKKKNPTEFGKYPGKTTLSGANVQSRTDYFSGQSISIFASIVDVGALAVYRLTDDAKPADSINWQNVFAPGIHLIWGIGATPICLGASVQYGPELRRVDANDDTVEATIESRAWRFGLSLTVDIPLFSLYAKTEKVD